MKECCKDTRRAALEEAAKIVDEYKGDVDRVAIPIAERIRALITPTTMEKDAREKK